MTLHLALSMFQSQDVDQITRKSTMGVAKIFKIYSNLCFLCSIYIYLGSMELYNLKLSHFLPFAEVALLIATGFWAIDYFIH